MTAPGRSLLLPLGREECAIDALDDKHCGTRGVEFAIEHHEQNKPQGKKKKKTVQMSCSQRQ